MTSNELREKFLKFFEAKGHKIVPSASLVPENDPSVLFTTAGMQQFKSYYTNPETAPAKKVVSIQKCLRTSDIEKVGDETHLTFFEMLGNFSFGGYGKEEAIKLALEFLEKELGIDHKRITSTYFSGDSALKLSADSVSIIELTKYFEPNKIISQGSADNFWGPTGDEGPCGPTVEFYVDGIEIWNLVFNEYYRDRDKKFTKLDKLGVDTGMGLERLAMIVQEKKNLFETDLFAPIIEKIQSLTTQRGQKFERIITDHMRAAVFLIADGVVPSNKDRGYVLRRLIRRAITYGQKLLIDHDFTAEIAKLIISNTKVGQELNAEEVKFRVTLSKGLKLLETKKEITGKEAFDLFQTYGFPFELTCEFAIVSNVSEFEEEFKKHQKLSRTASSGQFKGGLESHSDKIIRLHTVTHLLNAALRKVLGEHVWQKGSNITEERARFDFTHDQKMTDDEKQQVEKLVNDWIAQDLSVKKETISLDEARRLGAIGVFGEKYPDSVSVYTIYIPATKQIISREFCGGPHVEHTGIIGKFKIAKEEAVSAGVRRIKAIIDL